jgi:hypothetical protein
VTKEILWLDDLRNPTQAQFRVWITVIFGENVKVTWVKGYREFVNYLTENPMPDGMSLDHDLGTELTGLDCAKWLIEYCMNNAVKLPKYFVHSQNPVGRDNIQGYLDNYLKFQEPS